MPVTSPPPSGRSRGRTRHRRVRPASARHGGARHRGPWHGAERGSLTAETVLLAPVFLLFLLFLVGAGRMVEAQGEVNGAARDAARAASVERTMSDAEAAADAAAQESLSGDCTPEVSLAGSKWEEGGQVRAEVTCSLDLDFLGFGAAKDMRGDSVVPLEQYRRVED
ncbi:pilus assembly protein [Streptosporangium sp. NBC_01639]|uniref:TadE/TadG family type IV pilus assembly protein n=1 Tax=Streptosporangium sp. NBC_01639 TaxID=2975948 RepID=UPI00386D488C|nr:pilus assembly protein [Streptosporangium sp. NBC_01639]